VRRTTDIWKTTDWITVFLYLFLVIMGWINIYSAVYNEEHEKIFDISQRYGKQMIWILLALGIAFLTMLIEGRVFLHFSWIIYTLAILSLVVVLFAGMKIHGSRSWFNLGFVQIQPAEFVKIAVALALARYLSTFSIQLNKVRTVAISAALMALPAFLVLLQPDTGSALVFFSLILVLFREGLPVTVMLSALLMLLLFVLALVVNKLILALALVFIAFLVLGLSSRNLRTLLTALLVITLITGTLFLLNELAEINISPYLLILLGVAVSGPVYAYLIFRHRIKHGFLIFLLLAGMLTYTFTVDYFFHHMLGSHQQKRIYVLLGFESDPFGEGYNVNQSKIAIGSGGFSGKGFLEGTQTKFQFVPEQSTDFIFCTVGEEWGFLGSVIVLLLYLFFLLRIIRLAERQRAVFSRIYGYGVFSILTFHFLVNTGMTLGLVPVIGIPLPFFSYGGSSLWAFTILLFIFIRLDATRMELL
jgi:rod shape determining protein RodA